MDECLQINVKTARQIWNFKKFSDMFHIKTRSNRPTRTGEIHQYNRNCV